MLHLDLMSGIGGFALAARWHGMTTIGFCEIDPFCQRVLAKNFPGVPIHDDVTTLDAGTVRGWAEAIGIMAHPTGARRSTQQCECRKSTEIGKASTTDACSQIDLITGGYPCQPFSLAGKRMGEEDDRHLWPYLAALVADLRPTWCLLENVAGHISMGLDGVLSDLEEIGYACWPVVVPACALNAPHRRDRVWIMAHAEGSRSGKPAEWQRRQSAFRGSADFGGTEGTRTSTLAHAADGGVRRGNAPGQPGFAAFGGEALADAVFSGPQDDRRERELAGVGRQVPSTGSGGHHDARREAESRLGEPDDGIPGRLDVGLARAWDDDWEDGVPRVTDGCPDRANKLRALGNAIVPAVAYVLMAAMMEAA